MNFFFSTDNTEHESLSFYNSRPTCRSHCSLWWETSKSSSAHPWSAPLLCSSATTCDKTACFDSKCERDTSVCDVTRPGDGQRKMWSSTARDHRLRYNSTKVDVGCSEGGLGGDERSGTLAITILELDHGSVLKRDHLCLRLWPWLHFPKGHTCCNYAKVRLRFNLSEAKEMNSLWITTLQHWKAAQTREKGNQQFSRLNADSGTTKTITQMQKHCLFMKKRRAKFA